MSTHPTATKSSTEETWELEIPGDDIAIIAVLRLRVSLEADSRVELTRKQKPDAEPPDARNEQTEL